MSACQLVVVQLRAAYNQVVPTALDCVAHDRMTIILVLLKVIKDDDCSTTTLLFVGGRRVTYATKLSFHQYGT
jgi:hypothetical protein